MKDDIDNIIDQARASYVGQRNQEWLQQRLGKFTASRCKEWMSKGRGKEFGETALKYIYSIIAERLTGLEHVVDFRQTQWGEEHEEEAINAYIKKTKNKVIRAGFVTWRKNSLFGGTPDGFIGNDGLLEVKCPYTPANHIKAMALNEPYDMGHIWQIQANLLFTGRKWCDYVSYLPLLQYDQRKLLIIRINSSKEVHKEIEERAEKITALYNEILSKL